MIGNQTIKDTLDACFSEAISESKIPGVAAIALDSQGNVIYQGSFGTTNMDEPKSAKVDENTVWMMWSCTKLVVCVAALQLMEKGKFDLDDEVEQYLPAISELQVLKGYDQQGLPILEPAVTKITVRMLMTHTSGLAYDFFDPDTRRWKEHEGRKLSAYSGRGSLADFMSPLVVQPGKCFKYGTSIDWLGFLIEAVSGLSLDEYVERNILQVLEMHDTGAHVREDQQVSLMHVRTNGILSCRPQARYAANPEKYGGGHYLHSTLHDFSNFLVTLLAGGCHPISHRRILQDQTVNELLFRDQISCICSSDGIGEISSVDPALSNNGTFLPGLRKAWSCGLMLNSEDSTKGRLAGSGSWSGLGNIYYFIDPAGGRCALIMSSIFPFLDPEVCHLFDHMERAVYGHPAAKTPGEVGSNWSA